MSNKNKIQPLKIKMSSNQVQCFFSRKIDGRQLDTILIERNKGDEGKEFVVQAREELKPYYESVHEKLHEAYGKYNQAEAALMEYEGK